jgi:putative PIN family toxin of toxin-antitoxin system
VARLIVVDTNVLVAAIRSRRGASFGLLRLVGTGAFDVAVSVPLVLEYEDALLRVRGRLSADDVRAVVDYICAVGRLQNIFYLWRPLLRDPKDDMVAEVAVASGADSIVTHNLKDFSGVQRFGVTALSPAVFLKSLRGRK